MQNSHLVSRRYGGCDSGTNLAAENTVTILAASVKRSQLPSHQLEDNNKNACKMKIRYNDKEYSLDFPLASYVGFMCETEHENLEIHFLAPNVNSPDIYHEYQKKIAELEPNEQLKYYLRLYFPFPKRSQKDPRSEPTELLKQKPQTFRESL